jgi:hypothetical protein
MAWDGRGASDVRGRPRDAGVYLRIGGIGTNETLDPIQTRTEVIHWDADVVLRSTVIIDLAEDTRRRIDRAQSIA